jgi:hypothetical protein
MFRMPRALAMARAPYAATPYGPTQTYMYMYWWLTGDGGGFMKNRTSF